MFDFDKLKPRSNFSEYENIFRGFTFKFEGLDEEATVGFTKVITVGWMLSSFFVDVSII